jgi:hypothetical protein
MNLQLNEDNFIMYAIKNYDNPTCKGLSEFNDDIKKFVYLKRLFRKYRARKDLKERLILNHLIVLYNLFGAEATTNMLFYKIEKRYWPQLKTFLIFLNIMPENYIISHTDGNVHQADIPVDQKIIEVLRAI